MDYDKLSKDELLSKIEELEHNVINSEKINERLAHAEEMATQQRLVLKFINSMAIPSADNSTVDEFSEILLKAVKEYTGAVLATFSFYNPDKKELLLLHIEADHEMYKTVLKIAGDKIVKIASPVDDETYQLITKDIVGTLSTFTEVSFGYIPTLIDKAIRASTGIDRLYPIAHVIEGELYGTTMLAFKKGQTSPSIELLESYAHLMSVSLRRYNAEKALQDSEIKHRTYFEDAPLGIIIANDKGKYIDVNPGASELLGYTQDELLELSIPDVLANEKDIDSFQKLKEEGKLSYETELKKKDGSIVDVGLDAVLLPNNRFIAFHTNITERKKALEKAEENEIKFKAAFYTSPDSVNINKMDGEYVEINEGFTRLTGYTKDDVLGKLSSEINIWAVPEDREKLVDALKKFGIVENLESVFKSKDGRLIPALMSAKIITLKNEPHILSVTRVISERKKFEQELKEAKAKAEKKAAELKKQQALFETMFNTIKEAVVITNTKREIVLANNGVLSTFGFKPKEVIGKQTKTFYADTDKFNEAGNNVFNKDAVNKDKQYLTYYKHKNNGVFPGETFGAKLYDDQGEWIGNIGIMRDVSEREKFIAELKIAKEKAEENEANITAIIEGTNNSIWAFNKNYQILYINQIFQQEFLQSFGVLLKPGDSLVEALPETLRPLWRPRYDRVLANEQFTLEDAVPTENGTIYIQVSFNPIVKNGQVIGGSCFGSDITERKLAELELIKAKEKAEESDRLKSAFLANMSHEIRTPMNGILGFTSLLKEQELTGEDQQKFIDIIEKSGERMLNTINDIVDISKIESGQVDVEITDINLNKQLEELSDFFLPEARNKQIKLSIVNRVPDQQTDIKSDAEKLNSILTNLMKNAIKYTPNGSIEFGCSVKENQLEFYVKDTGIGIPKDRQKAVFDRFVQADIDDSKVYEGSGLGLAISKAYVEMLGGEIWVESEEGVGSKFHFTIPYTAHDKKNRETNIQDSNKKLSIKKGLRVLVVEDEEFSLAFLKVILKEYEKDMLVAKTGTEAVEMCRDHPDIDLILMDIKMPEIDGYEATRQIREFNKDVFIVAQTAYAQSPDREKSIEAGCDDYISKPINREKLLEIISNRFSGY